jgi:hypothetical protein
MSKPEQSQTETVDASKMSLEELKNHINSEVAKTEAKSTENPAEKSEKSEEDSKTEEPVKKETQGKEQSSEEKKEVTSETETPSDKQKEKKEDAKPLDYEKSYKELQRKFTQNNQASKAQIDELNQKLADLTALVKGKTSSTTEEKSIIDDIRAKSPETAQLFERFRDELQAKYEKSFEEKLQTELAPLKSEISVSKESDNAGKFTQGLENFMKSDLAVYEPDLIDILNEKFESQEALEKAVRKDPSIFSEVKKELASRILDGTVETKAKKAASKSSKEEKIAKKKEEIENSETVRKPKSSAPVDAELTVEASKKIPLADLRKRLPVKED